MNQGEATEGPRTVQATLVNEFEDVKWQAETDVFVQGINDPTQVTLSDLPVSDYFEGQEPVLLFNEIILNDPDNPHVGAVQIEFKDGTFTPGDIIASDISEKFSTNFNSTTGKMTISPVNSEITTDELQEFLRGFTFSSNSKNPVIDKDFRTIEISITDLGGGTENTSPETTTQLITFNVIESNDPPTIAVSDAVVSEPVGASSVISLDLGPNISISDADDEFLSEVILTISNDTYLPDGANATDSFVFPSSYDGFNIVASDSDRSLTLTPQAPKTVAEFNNLISNISIKIEGDDPTGLGLFPNR